MVKELSHPHLTDSRLVRFAAIEVRRLLPNPLL